MVETNITLFGEEIKITKPSINKNKKGQQSMYDYDNFIDKFDVKKTTDDCYTPNAVYDAVVAYVGSVINLKGLEILRPFYPQGDYVNAIYPKDSIVIDNPPFSIISKIVQFYEEQGIKYFLFAAHLTLFGVRKASTYIVSGENITYENGAIIPTSFLSNIFGDTKIIITPKLNKAIKNTQEKKTTTLPKYKYPENLITVSRLAKLASENIEFRVNANEIFRVSQLDNQKIYKKSIFGSGFLISNTVKDKLLILEQKLEQKIEQKKLEQKIEQKKLEIEFGLSDKERQIIENLK